MYIYKMMLQRPILLHPMDGDDHPGCDKKTHYYNHTTGGCEKCPNNMVITKPSGGHEFSDCKKPEVHAVDKKICKDKFEFKCQLSTSDSPAPYVNVAANPNPEDDACENSCPKPNSCHLKTYLHSENHYVCGQYIPHPDDVNLPTWAQRGKWLPANNKKYKYEHCKKEKVQHWFDNKDNCKQPKNIPECKLDTNNISFVKILANKGSPDVEEGINIGVGPPIIYREGYNGPKNVVIGVGGGIIKNTPYGHHNPRPLTGKYTREYKKGDSATMKEGEIAFYKCQGDLSYPTKKNKYGGFDLPTFKNTPYKTKTPDGKPNWKKREFEDIHKELSKKEWFGHSQWTNNYDRSIWAGDESGLWMDRNGNINNNFSMIQTPFKNIDYVKCENGVAKITCEEMTEEEANNHRDDIIRFNHNILKKYEHAELTRQFAQDDYEKYGDAAYDGRSILFSEPRTIPDYKMTDYKGPVPDIRTYQVGYRPIINDPKIPIVREEEQQYQCYYKINSDCNNKNRCEWTQIPANENTSSDGTKKFFCYPDYYDCDEKKCWYPEKPQDELVKIDEKIENLRVRARQANKSHTYGDDYYEEDELYEQIRKLHITRYKSNIASKKDDLSTVKKSLNNRWNLDFEPEKLGLPQKGFAWGLYHDTNPYQDDYYYVKKGDEWFY